VLFRLSNYPGKNELTAYMAKHMPERGRVFIQAESELAAISMVFGLPWPGALHDQFVFPRHQLEARGISYLAGAQLRP